MCSIIRFRWQVFLHCIKNTAIKSYVIRDLQTMRTAASALNAIYPNSNLVKALYENTAKSFTRRKSSKNERDLLKKKVINSPDIVLPDVSGKEIALSSLRGKVVLLHFWAAEDRGLENTEFLAGRCLQKI